MKKITKSVLLLSVSSALMATASEAALLSTATLNFDAPVYEFNEYLGYDLAVGGSNFGIDTNGNGAIELSERTGIFANDGIVLGSVQPGSVSEPGIDSPWGFFGQQGVHFTNAPVTILSDDGVGNVELDFSGWSVNWNGIDIGLGGAAWGSNSNGVANMTCATDCSNGDSFSLFYTASVTEGPFAGIRYRLGFDSGNLALLAFASALDGPVEDYGVASTGTISSVPVPAAVWLFGSGLVGLFGFANRKKS